MYTATAGVVLPTTIIGSLPRPGWYTENLGRREFREAMVDRMYREQYLDAVSSYLRDQEVADLIRKAIKHIPAERLVISSEWGVRA